MGERAEWDLLARVRRDMAAGKSWREVSAGPTFTRKLMGRLDEETRVARIVDGLDALGGEFHGGGAHLVLVAPTRDDLLEIADQVGTAELDLLAGAATDLVTQQAAHHSPDGRTGDTMLILNRLLPCNGYIATDFARRSDSFLDWLDREHLGRRPPDAGRAAGDEDDTSLESQIHAGRVPRTLWAWPA